MIGKHIKGKSFRGLLNYLFGKDGARQIGGNMEGTNPRELAARIWYISKIKPEGEQSCLSRFSQFVP